jgi:hypothetical protein
MLTSIRGLSAATLLVGALFTGTPALADDATPAAPEEWSDTIKVSGHVEAGITANTEGSPDGLNFGHLFTDKEGDVLLNQAILTVERPIDTASPDVDVGFKLQGMYGSDARYTHFLGELDGITDSRNQFDIVEAYVNAHLPVLTAGGIDIKVGQFVTLEGAEVIYGPQNFFYSHSYIFNFGIPFKHTGVLTTTHVSKTLDVYAGITSGVNTTLWQGDNNGSPSFHGGIGLNLLEGALRIYATTHIGPEIPRGTPGVRPNKDLRYLNDITMIWKVNDKLTSTTDLNYIRDDGFNADGGGVAQYLTYAAGDRLAFGIRGEVWRDDDGFFVAAFPGNRDFANAQKGLPATIIGGGRTTYGALTLGLNYRQPMPGGTGSLLIRPEVRYDRSLNGTTPFGAGARKQQFTGSIDAILMF